MNLYIMTRGRVGAQRTLASIPSSWRGRTHLVCPLDELTLHKDVNVIGVPQYVDNYSRKMKWIVEDGMQDGNDKAVILDDDLIFSRRITHPDGRPGLKTVESHELDEYMPQLFGYIEFLLNDTALVGVHPRQFGHTQPLPFKVNGKVICVQGINRKLVGKIPEMAKYPILSDVVLNATLLSRGVGNKIITSFCQDWGPSQATGGCSSYRTVEMQREACKWLAGRFGPHIKYVEKESKDEWLTDEGGKRPDFTGQWQSLFNAGAAGLLGQRTGEHQETEGGGSTETLES